MIKETRERDSGCCSQKLLIKLTLPPAQTCSIHPRLLQHTAGQISLQNFKSGMQIYQKLKKFIVGPFRLSLFSVSSTLLLQISSTLFLILIVEIFFLTSSLFSASSPVSFPFPWPASHFSALFSFLPPFFIFFSSPLPHESPHTCSLFTLYCL